VLDGQQAVLLEIRILIHDLRRACPTHWILGDDPESTSWPTFSIPLAGDAEVLTALSGTTPGAIGFADVAVASQQQVCDISWAIQ
jgi:hypothetical protein